jgi:hypothetical protein
VSFLPKAEARGDKIAGGRRTESARHRVASAAPSVIYWPDGMHERDRSVTRSTTSSWPAAGCWATGTDQHACDAIPVSRPLS